MLVSVVIRTRDEAPRLRLTLASLARQTVAPDVIVVDDGSADDATERAVEESEVAVVGLRHAESRGRTAASNTGARVARGDILLFLDGDALLAPDAIARHLAAYSEPGVLVRGETCHLRCTRFFRDPEAGTPNPGAEDHVARMTPAELERSRVTRAQVLDDFPAIERRARPGIYPGIDPHRLFEIETDALRNHPDLRVLWMASSGQNLSVRRDDFERVGGFDEEIDNNEHRDLTLRLYRRGVRLRLAPARSFHLTHRVGWRDPLADTLWARPFAAKHPPLVLELLTRFWRSLAGDPAIPTEERLLSLPAVEDAFRRAGVDPLAELPRDG